LVGNIEKDACLDITTKVMQHCQANQAERHFFGLSQARWQSLHGQSFWITGAATGFGFAMAHALLSAGAQIIISGRREHKLLEARQQFEHNGLQISNCHIVVMDVCSLTSIEQACERVRTLCPALNGLVHSAALSGGAAGKLPLLEGSDAIWQAVMHTNVRGPWLLTRSILGHMANSPKILLLSSEAGWAGTPGVGIYNISKAALNSLGHSMAQELAVAFPDKDIQMNVLVPGEAKSEMNRDGKDSPFTVVSMTLILLSHPPQGPNGRFFHRDGRHLRFAHTLPYPETLI
jgi:NAD(P)-dependent dehydrogenase (short-subunit alcohol dehydrogenase family)